MNRYGESVFAGCPLTSVLVKRSEPATIYDNVFTNCANATLYVPLGSVDAYANAEYWKDFKEIKEFVKDESAAYAIEKEEKTLTVKAVAETTEKEVEIHESVTVDGEQYPVTAIASSAFESNTTIKQVSIPETIEKIGENAFADCVNLSAIYCHSEEPIALSIADMKANTRNGNESTTNVFTGVDKVTCVLFVPAGSISKYMTATGWKDFKNIVEIGTEFILGDVNGDKVLDKNDLDAIVNHIMGNPQKGILDVDMADINKDSYVNAADIVEIGKLMRQK